MAAWSDPEVLLTVLAAAAVLVLPGLAIGLALRLRGFLLLAASAPSSVAVLAGSAVAGAALGVGWDLRTPLVATAAAAVVAGAARAARRPRRAPAHGVGRASAQATQVAGQPAGHGTGELGGGATRARHRTRRPPASVRWGAPLLGAAAGGTLVATLVTGAITSPSQPSQAHDIVFHLNAVQYVLDTRDGSSLHLTGLLNGGRGGFYPAAWHDAVSLVVQLTGASVVVATNATALVVAALVWPVSVVHLVQQVFAGSPAHTAAGGVLCAVLPAMPYLLLDWGVLYPVLLAMALVPVALGVVVAVVGSGWAVDRPPTGVLLALCALVVGPALALAHPSGLFTLALLGAPAVLAAAAAAARQHWASPVGRRRVLAGGAALAAVVLAGLLAVTSSPLLASVSAYEWAGGTTAPQAAGEALFGAPPDGRRGNLLAGLLLLVGAEALLRARAHRPDRGGDQRPGEQRPAARSRWVLLAWLAPAGLYVIAQVTTSHPLTGPWYNDSYRLLPVVAVPAVLLAAHGAVTVGAAVAGAAEGLRRGAARHPRPAGRAAGPAVLVTGLAVALAGTAALVPGTGRGSTSAALAAAHEYGERSPLLTTDEVELFARARAVVPEGAVIANDPFDGSGLSYVLAGLEPLFPHMASQWDADGAVVKDRLADVGEDPEVCAAVRREGVTHLFALGPRYLDFVPRAAFFTQVQPAADSPAFEVVEQVGQARLLRLTTCAGEPVPEPPAPLPATG